MRALFLWFLSAAACLAALPVRVGVVDFGTTGSSGLIAREIAKLEGVEVAHERLDEKEKTPVTNEERKALGVRIKVQLLILVDIKGDAFAYVDAATGEELFRIRDENPDALVRTAFILVEELRDAERSPNPQ